MRIVRVATGLVATLALVSCESVTEPPTDPSPDALGPSFAVVNPVVEEVTGSANFYWTSPSGAEGWRTSSLTAHKYADGSVAGTYQANYHGNVSYRGRITCFTIVGNEAWLGLIIENSSNPSLVGSLRVAYLQDNGSGSNAEPDRSTAWVRLSSLDYETLEEYCLATPTIRASSVYDVETGDIRIHSLNPVVEQVTGSAVFHRTAAGQTYLHRSAFTARRYADGTVDGMYQQVGRTGPHWSRVYCFTVEGNEAWLGVIVERGEGSPPALGEGRGVYVVDNGEGIDAPPDRSTAFPPLGTALLGDPPEGYDEWTLDLYCAETPEVRAISVFDLEAGNIQILP